MTTFDVYAKWTLPPVVGTAAAVLVLGALVGAVVIFFARAFVRSRLARQAEASVGPHPPALVEGAEVVLVGTVQHFADHDVAVKIRIEQRGAEQETSGSFGHSWTEIDREIILAPFLLELATGETVLVHPPKNVDVADALDQKVWIDRNKRVLSAELVPGEKIFARGRLQRSDRALPGSAYRDTTWGWELRPAAGQMLLSSEPLGQGMRSRAAFHRAWGLAALVVLCVTQATLAGFWSRLAGRTETVTVTSNAGYDTVDDEGHHSHHCTVRVFDEDRELPCGHGIQIGDHVLVRMTSGGAFELGGAATLTWYHAAILIGITAIFLALYPFARRISRPWFREKVIEHGQGPLPDPP